MSAEMDVEGLVSTLRCGKPRVFKPMEPDRCICTRCTAADVIERLCRERLSTSKGLLEQRDSLARQLQEAVEARDRYQRELESIQRFTAGHAAFTAEGQIHKSVCAALTERSKP